MLMRRLMTPEPSRAREFLERISALWVDLPDFTTDELATINAPTLVIAGDKDEYLSTWPDPLQVFRATAEAIPGAKMEVVHGGAHGLHMSHATLVNQLILSWLKTVDAVVS